MIGSETFQKGKHPVPPSYSAFTCLVTANQSYQTMVSQQLIDRLNKNATETVFFSKVYHLPANHEVID